MYQPSHFEEKRSGVLHQLIHDYPLGTLIIRTQDGLDANHIPFVLETGSPDAPQGVLRAHVARGNPLWRSYQAGEEALVVFQGPQAYITPAWYAEKKVSGKAVPTYNYVAVHAYGPMRVMHDPEWLLEHLQQLTNRHEAGRAEPWQVADAPADYIEKMLAAIVGVEIPLSRLMGKWKTSQNRSETDRVNIAAGLCGDGALAMAGLVRASVG